MRAIPPIEMRLIPSTFAFASRSCRLVRPFFLSDSRPAACMTSLTTGAAPTRLLPLPLPPRTTTSTSTLDQSQRSRARLGQSGRSLLRSLAADHGPAGVHLGLGVGGRVGARGTCGENSLSCRVVQFPQVDAETQQGRRRRQRGSQRRGRRGRGGQLGLGGPACI